MTTVNDHVVSFLCQWLQPLPLPQQPPQVRFSLILMWPINVLAAAHLRLHSSLRNIWHCIGFIIAEATQAPATTTTTAAPATTTAAAEEACTLREGMKDERTIRPGWVQSEPATENADNVRPNKDAKWTPDSQASPSLLITVTDKEAIPVGSVEITGDVKEITVFYTSGNDQPFKPVTEKRSTEPKVQEPLQAAHHPLSCPQMFS